MSARSHLSQAAHAGGMIIRNRLSCSSLMPARPSLAKIVSLSSQNHPIFCRLPDGTNLCFSNCVKVHGRGEGFVPTAHDYRRLAAECLQLSSKISAELRCIFIALAHGWAHLAHRLEEKDRAAGESAADE